MELPCEQLVSLSFGVGETNCSQGNMEFKIRLITYLESVEVS